MEVLTPLEDGTGEMADPDLLRRTSELGMVLFTQDIRFRVLAEGWQRSGNPFAGLIYAHQRNSIGALVHDLELIAKATESADWQNQVGYLPL